MTHERKNLDQNEVELIITIQPAGYQKEMEKAAVRMSERAAIHGFRPGKAPYDVVKQQLGEIKILEEAMQRIVEMNFAAVLREEKLTTVGMPEITIQKAAPGNDFVFKAKVALLPEVKLPDIGTLKVEKKTAEVEEKAVDQVINDLRKMQAKEVIKTGPAKKEDKVVVNMEMFLDKVPVEGGQAPNHQVYLNEDHYIPGFSDQILGLEKDQEKEFSLKFPDTHYQKHLSGKTVDFKIKVKDVFSIEYPELDDEFAKKLGQKSPKDLRDLVFKNLTNEAEQKEEQRLEAALLEDLIAKSEFGAIPQVLMDSEKRKMFNELKQSLEERGIEMERYLQDIKKTEKEIHDDFADRATTRVKASLVSRSLTKEHNITVSEEEIDAEGEVIKQAYNNDPRVLENLKRHDVRDTLAVAIQNRKVMSLLKEKVLGIKNPNPPTPHVHGENCHHDHDHGHGHEHVHEEEQPGEEKTVEEKPKKTTKKKV